jgi:hypothetical protein
MLGFHTLEYLFQRRDSSQINVASRFPDSAHAHRVASSTRCGSVEKGNKPQNRVAGSSFHSTQVLLTQTTRPKVSLLVALHGKEL